MFCYKCGAAMADEAATCANCGTPGVRAITFQTQPAEANPSVAVVSRPPVGAVPPQTEDKAVISLVLGILSLVGLSILGGIPAIILGRMSKKNIQASAGRLAGEGMATAGIVMGWISVVLALVLFAIILLMLVYLIPASR